MAASAASMVLAVDLLIGLQIQHAGELHRDLPPEFLFQNLGDHPGTVLPLEPLIAAMGQGDGEMVTCQLSGGAVKEAVDMLACRPECICQAGQIGHGELICRIPGQKQHPSQLQRSPELGLHLQQHRFFQYIGKAQLSRQLPALGVNMKMLDLTGSHRRREIRQDRFQIHR